MPLPTLGIYAPLPGSRSGIADYAQYTASALADSFDVSFVSLSNYVPPAKFDHVLYHVGNGVDSAAAFWALDDRPGPVILHEYVLSQFFIEHHALLDDATNQRVRSVLGAICGRGFANSVELDRLMRTEREWELHYLDVGIERLIVERATIVFVHSRTSLDVLCQRHGDVVQLLEFPAEPLPSNSRQNVRESLGIPYSATVFGSFGFVGTSKRLPIILDAWAALGGDSSVRHLLIVGAGVHELSSAVGPTITMIDYVSDGPKYAELLGVLDVGIQLRSPTLGETSGIVASLLASSIPVIVSTESILPAWAPPGLVHVVPVGAEFERRLASAVAEHIHCNRDRQLARDAHTLPRWCDSITSALCGVANVRAGDARA